MRTRIHNGQLEVDLISTRQQATDVINLALAVGLPDFSSFRSEDGSLGLLFTAPEGAWATSAFAAMLILTAALNGTDAKALVEQHLAKNPAIAEAVQAFVPVPQPA